MVPELGARGLSLYPTIPQASGEQRLEAGLSTAEGQSLGMNVGAWGHRGSSGRTEVVWKLLSGGGKPRPRPWIWVGLPSPGGGP